MPSLMTKFIVMLVSGLFFTTTVFAASGNASGNEGTRKIGEGVYSFTIGEGNYSMFVVGDNGVAIFEPFNSRQAQKLLEAVRHETDKPIEYVFISHNHWDHASGGKVFSDVGAKTVMHKLAAEWVNANPGGDAAPPDVT